MRTAEEGKEAVDEAVLQSVGPVNKQDSAGVSLRQG